MDYILLRIAFVGFVFFLGYSLKITRFVRKKEADLFLKIVFFISLPALVLFSISHIELSWKLAVFPVAAFIVILITYCVSLIIGKKLKLERSSFGVFLAGTMIMNTGFILPFVIMLYGQEGTAKLVLFDFGNIVMTFGFVYYLTRKYGEKESGFWENIKKFLLSPPLWALLIGIWVNLNSFEVPLIITRTFYFIGLSAVPLVLFSLGVYFDPRFPKKFLLFCASSIRIFFGFFLGLLLTKIFGFEGINKVIILLACSAPAGYNTLVFSSISGLDKEFASDLISFSIAIDIFLIPLIVVLFSP
ncbi:AEC family transporter [bacterium]|nr:AEC family transporter [bacterium]